jgi:hypothetical protein
MAAEMAVRTQTDERIERVAALIGRHTVDVCCLAATYTCGQLTRERYQEQIAARCTRTALALLALVHPEGPP